MNRLRGRRVASQPLAQLDFMAPDSGLAALADGGETRVELACQLAQLPPRYREAIVLRHLEQLAFPEVAERMGRSLDSVKKLWVRGLASLRKLLEGHA